MTHGNKIGTLWLVGCGNMGAALLERWSAAGLATRILVIDPALPAVPPGVELLAALPAPGARPSPDVAVLAVKSQIAAAALSGLAERLGENSLVISIMAGLTLGDISRMVGERPLVRAMPNTPAAVGKGMTALHMAVADAAVTAVADALFMATGTTVWLDAESQFDAVTAVSGSGPAYVFRFIEALAAAAEAAGLPADLAENLARGTVIGAAALADGDARSARDLRAAVTSPGGTTQAGLEALDADPGLPALVRSAVRAAATRSRELSENR